MDLQGPRGPFGTGKSSCMCRLATSSLYLAVFIRLQGGFGSRIADFEVEGRHLCRPFAAASGEFLAHTLCGSPSHP